VLEVAIGSGPDFSPPPGPLASPDLFKCHLVPNAPFRAHENFSCEFSENQKTCVFTMNELVATNIDEVDAKGKVVIGAGKIARFMNFDDRGKLTDHVSLGVLTRIVPDMWSMR
jgi:hypothetical protein